MRQLVEINRVKERNIDEYILCFGVMYNIPSLEYFQDKMKITKKRYEVLKLILSK